MAYEGSRIWHLDLVEADRGGLAAPIRADGDRPEVDIEVDIEADRDSLAGAAMARPVDTAATVEDRRARGVDRGAG